jgi:ABC-type uncharacterized transport system permease subunit
MNVAMLIYLIVLFVVLTPGQFLTLPSADSSKLIINVVHAVVFAAVYHFTHNMVMNAAGSPHGAY